jgi:AcrR family transcriptional regulator
MSDKKVRSLQRVIEIAAKAFASRKFNEVSISEISEEAHCSTSTIYAAFGSKENLFQDAMAHLLQTQSPVVEQPAGSRSSLNTLLGFAEARIRTLASPVRRGAIRAISAQPELAEPLIDCLKSQECGRVTRLIQTEIAACVEAGVLRRLDTQVIAYMIMAVTAYEPLVYGLLYGDDKSVDIMRLLRKVFTPLVTEVGEMQLRAYFGEVDKDAAPFPSDQNNVVVAYDFPVGERRRSIR